MNTKEETQKMRKINMRIFPTYKKISWDYLFYYTIDFLFLTQIKNISAANVVLANSIYYFFNLILQIPANIFVEFFGRKNSIVIANFLNCFYMVIIMITRGFPDLILAQFISSMANSIKDIAEPGLLNASIPPSKYKGDIFSKINAKGAAGYYLLGGISKIVAGFLFGINAYLPIICSLVVLIIAAILSLCFIEPIRTKKTDKQLTGKQQLKDIKDGFVFILKSERLKALILSSALITALLQILLNYNVSILQDLKLSSLFIGIVSAIGSLLSAFSSKKQDLFAKKLKNKLLMCIALTISIICIIQGVCALKAEEYILLIGIIVLGQCIGKFMHGLYYTIIEKYLRNFTNKNIDTKIFAANNLFVGLANVASGVIASFILDKTTTAKAMIIIGIAFTFLYIFMGIYMRTRVGLKPEEYSKEERKYDEQKIN